MGESNEGSGDDLHDRRVRASLAGHSGDHDAATAASLDHDASVRLLGFGALARLGVLDEHMALIGLHDSDSRVVRRVVEAVARQKPAMPPLDLADASNSVDARLLELVDGPDDAVAETAAWAIGERHQQIDTDDESPPNGEPVAPDEVVNTLRRVTTTHRDALVRESAAAALGAIGAGLDAILAATTDKATVRRRAVLALASFEGPEVTAALIKARTDRDWQVRQAAEDLLRDG